jgi:hypothetical protein
MATNLVSYKIDKFLDYAEFASIVQDQTVLVIKIAKGEYKTVYEDDYKGEKKAIICAFEGGELL